MPPTTTSLLVRTTMARTAPFGAAPAGPIPMLKLVSCVVTAAFARKRNGLVGPT